MSTIIQRPAGGKLGSSIIATMGYATLSLLIVLYTALASRYFTHDGSQFFPDGEFYENQTAKYLRYYVPFIAHAGCGLTAMILGPFLINARLRARSPSAHRLLGKVYLLAVLIGAIASSYFAIHVFGGVSPMLASWVKVAWWLTAAAMAWVTIRRGQVKEHRVWMLRSYAISVEPIAFKLWAAGAFAFGVQGVTVMRVFSWISAVTTVAAVELYIARRGWSLRRTLSDACATTDPSSEDLA